MDIGANLHHIIRPRLQGGEEGHEIFVLSPGGRVRHFLVGLDDCAGLQGLRLHFQIHFGVAVGRLQGDMAEPGADGVDIDAGAE